MGGIIAVIKLRNIFITHKVLQEDWGTLSALENLTQSTE